MAISRRVCNLKLPINLELEIDNVFDGENVDSYLSGSITTSYYGATVGIRNSHLPCTATVEKKSYVLNIDVYKMKTKHTFTSISKFTGNRRITKCRL